MISGHDLDRPTLQAADRASTSRGNPPAKATPPSDSENEDAEKKKPWLEKWLENEEEEAFNLPFTD